MSLSVEVEFYEACKRGQVVKAKELIDEVDVNWQNPNDDRKTPMHAAILAGSVDCVMLLLDGGADLEVRDDFDKTALHLAVSVGEGAVSSAVVEGVLSQSAKRRREKNALMKELTALKGGKKTGAPKVTVPTTSRTIGNLAQPKYPPPNAHSQEEKNNKGSTSKELPSDSSLLTPRELPEGSIRDKKRKDMFESIIEAARNVFDSAVSQANLRQLRMLDDPPQPVYRLVDAMCFIAKIEPPRTWPEMQLLLRQPAFRDALANANPASYSAPQAQQIKQCISRLEELLNAEKLPPAPYAICKWVQAFEKGTTYAMTYPVVHAQS